MADLSKLTVKLGADDSELDSGLRGAESKVSRFADGIKTAGAAAGAAVGATLAAGFAKNLEFESAQAKLQAQLGGSAQFAGQMGQVAGNLYANAYGESMDEVGNAVRAVVQSGALMEDATNEQIESITAKAMSMASAFDLDVSESMRAVGQMVRTEMAPNAEAAMDLITRAFQQLGPQAQDTIDTFVEYGTQFRKLGLDGPTALGLIQQAVKAGARDTDVAADALKEFSIRAIDGSKATAEGFKALGLDAADMSAKIAAGGPTAAAALDLTLDKLRSIQDPVAQSAAAVALFGTQAEDLGAALFAMDTTNAAKQLGNVAGAASQLDATLGDTAQARITGMQRSVEQWTASLVTAQGPIGSLAAAVMAFGGPVTQAAGSLGMVALAAGQVSPKLTAAATATATSAASMVASLARWSAGVVAQGAVASASMAATAARYVAAWVVMAAGAMARAAIMAAAWVVAMGPVGWIIAAVIGLVALIVLNWDKVKNVTTAVFGAVWNFLKGVWDGIKALFWQAVAWVVNLFMNWSLPGLIIKHWDTIKRVFTEGIATVVNWMKSLPGRILGALGDLGRLLWNAGSSIISGLWNGIKAKGGWLKDKILGFIRSFVPGPVLRFLGISSPSTLFAGIGRNVALGLAEGITSSEGAVRSAATRLADSAVVDVQAGGFGLTAPTARRLPSGVSAAAARAGGRIGLEVSSSGRAVDEFLAELIRRFVRVNGGDVQKALGES